MHWISIFLKPAKANAEALSYFPQPKDFILGPDEYLNHISKLKQAVDIPIIGSITELA